MPDISNLLISALGQRKDAVFYELSQSLASGFPDQGIVETEADNFKLFEYAWSGACSVEERPGVHSQMETEHNDAHHSLWTSQTNSWHSVHWQGAEMDIVTIGVQGQFCRQERHYVIAETEEIAKRFILECCEWNAEVRGEVLVFSGGWYKDEDLFAAIQSTTLDSLVLEGALKDELETDFRTFFDSREVDAKHRIPWKRGVLFLGPPGNGKTHAIKGLINLLQLPCLYVRTFAQRHITDQDSIRSVFKRARTTAPCMLIFEDLDSILDDENRSYFLNELDGFASNEGIMTIATTNHPERLDPAILDRPSRFDRKYTFNLPDESSRVAYLTLQNAGLEPTLKLSEAEIHEVASLTEDFSYAYLKELVLSSMMKWINASGSVTMAESMSSQLDSLKAQMQTPAPEPGPAMPRMPDYMAAWRKARRGK